MSSTRGSDLQAAPGGGQDGNSLADTDPCDAELARRLSEGAAAFPAVGTEFLGFRLIDELGRGSFSRVYLARQADLADRPVALKVSVDLSGEPQVLARLQHTNIVPIYSAHRAGSLQAVCMPYFGPTTLADALEDLHGRPGPPESGEALVHLLRDTVLQGVPQSPGGPPPPRPETGATLERLRGMRYVEAVLWLGVRLADGLGHAHERGVLHRDLKPANVLLGDDGQPMLLDFNLAAASELPAGSPPTRLGGTLPYMAPEQLEAFRGAAPDARADLYSLGVMLFELLGGARPFPDRPGPLPEALSLLSADRLRPPPRLRGRSVTPAVAAIVRRCLEPDPARRYQTAQELREDLQRQLDHLPLRHAREPLRERARKWARRHPRLASPVTGLAALAIAAAVWAVFWAVPAAWRSEQEARDARKARQEAAQAALAAGARDGAREEFAKFRQEADTLGWLEEKLNLAELPPSGGPLDHDDPSPDLGRCRRALRCFRILDDPAWYKSAQVAALPEHEREQLRVKAGELLYLYVRAEAAGAARALHWQRGTAPARAVLALWGPAPWEVPDAVLRARLQFALRLNESALKCRPGTRLLPELRAQRVELLRLLGAEETDPDLLAQAKQDQPDPRRLYRDARAAYLAGRYEQALGLLTRVAPRTPAYFSAWLLRGLCHFQAGQYEDAAAAYTACIALQPKFMTLYFYRGLARTRGGQGERALKDFSLILEAYRDREGPELARVYVNRAVALQGMEGRRREAIADLTRALKLEPASPDAYALRAKLRALQRDLSEARADLAELLKFTPDDCAGWLARAVLRVELAPQGDTRAVREALADVDRGLALAPTFARALRYKARLLAWALERPRDALPVFDRLLELAPKDLDARLDRTLLRARLGQRAAAERDAERCLTQEMSPRVCYRAAAVYALSVGKPRPPGLSRFGPRRRALELLEYALRNGWGQKRVARDADFRALRADGEFDRLVRAVEVFYRLTKDKPPRLRPEP